MSCWITPSPVCPRSRRGTWAPCSRGPTPGRGLIRWRSPSGAPSGPRQPCCTDQLTIRSRPVVERASARARAARTRARRIYALIREALTFEWERLAEAREAFLNLGLPQAAELPRLVGESLERVRYALGTYPARPSRPAALSRLLEEQSFAATLTADVMVRSDPAVREQERRAGRLIRGTVSAVDQRRPNFRPCTVSVVTDQTVLRVRRGTVLGLLGTNVSGRVTSVLPVADGVRIDIGLANGVRNPPGIGSTGDWSDSDAVDLRFRHGQVYGQPADDPPALLASELPAAQARSIPDDLVGVARALRR